VDLTPDPNAVVVVTGIISPSNIPSIARYFYKNSFEKSGIFEVQQVVGQAFFSTTNDTRFRED
jgi:hypothetical protein